MKGYKKGFGAVGILIIIGLLLVLGGLGYWFKYSGTQIDEKKKDAESLQADLDSAWAKVESERSKLAGLKEKFSAERPVNTVLQNSFAKLAGVLNSTVSYQSNPEERAVLVTSMQELGRKKELSLTREVPSGTLNDLMNELLAFKAYLEGLLANPNLSASDKANLEASLAQVNAALSSLNNVGSNPKNPTVTEADLVSQQQQLEEAEAELAVLEEQTPDVITEEETNVISGGSSGTSPPPAEPIQTTPGKPKLIQGGNND